VLLQAITSGDVTDIAEARQIVANSFGVEEYLPRETARWNEAFGRFQTLS
jgi:hypothetical protein